ncbi:polysaccharide deacetylase family protein [Roseateles sp.]|uniref:polysaccharide deacetylase family protein n=1 Tax=Roseateles sp. TaxID=1971397 RepID=UPI0039E975FF
MPPGNRPRTPLAAFAAALLTLLGACSTPNPPAMPPAPPPTIAAPADAGPQGQVVGRSERLLVYVPRAGDTLADIAVRHLGSAERAWQIAEANGDVWQPVPGQPLVVPLAWPRTLGVGSDGVQAVPILCYHRFGGPPTRMNITAARFEAQMQWLATHQYQVVRLSDFAQFLAGRRALPRRSVVITIDDGYESVYRQAFPVLRKYGFPATLFVYSDFVGSRDGLSWQQMEEMQRSGLIDVQAHSKSHRNLVDRLSSENESAYRQRIDMELRQPRTLIEKNLGAAGARVTQYAYPYGDANEAVLNAMRRDGSWALGLTVDPGGNPFYAAPLLLRRTMVYGDQDLDEFRARVQLRAPARQGAVEP